MHEIPFTVFDELPEDLLECEATRLHTILPGPSLIHVPGKRGRALFVSVLLHGNETTGWEAVRRLLRHYADRRLPRSLSLFIGNVAAAGQGRRRLPDQQDYNRIWRGEADTPEHRLARRVLAELDRRELFAAVDVHNNTGKNPHYACVNRLENRFLHLARLFSRTVVYFIKPDSVLSLAMASRCPSITIECGQPGQARGVDHVFEFLDACLHLDHFPDHPLTARDVDLFHTVATVKIPPRLRFGFGDVEDADLCLLPDIDRFNFTELPAGTAFGRILREGVQPFEVTDEAGREVFDRFFTINAGWIQTRTPVMPSMLTLNREVIRQDCLCYLMERLPLPG